MIQVVGMIAAVAVLLVYLGVARGLPVRAYHLANVITAVPIGASSFVRGAYPAFFISTSFGILGLVGLLRKETK